MKEGAIELPELNCPEPVEGTWYFYVLSCRDGSFYVGSTDNIKRRFYQHQLGETSVWTRFRRPVHLVYWESYTTLVMARQREQQVKGWVREKKLRLVSGDWGKIL